MEKLILPCPGGMRRYSLLEAMIVIYSANGGRLLGPRLSAGTLLGISNCVRIIRAYAPFLSPARKSEAGLPIRPAPGVKTRVRFDLDYMDAHSIYTTAHRAC